MEDRDSLPRVQANQQVGPTRFIERILPSKTSRIEPLNRSSRRKEALTSIPRRRVSLLTSAATSFMGRGETVPQPCPALEWTAPAGAAVSFRGFPFSNNVVW